jgi:transcription elongation factor GreA
MHPQETAARAQLPMTASDLEKLRAEIRGLRLYSCGDIADGLWDARQYADGSNNDELLAVREEQMVVEARIALLEHDRAGRQSLTLRLVSAHAIGGGTISAASPMGRALVGSRAGAVVSLELPNGRSRSVRVVSVKRERRAAPDAY